LQLCLQTIRPPYMQQGHYLQ